MLKIGGIQLSQPYIMAPIAGYTDSPFRRMVKKAGAGLLYTQLISANALIHNNEKTLTLLKHLPEEKPIAVQLLGRDIDVLIKASQTAMDAGADIIDLNLGCPARNVVNNGTGSALLKNPELIKEIITAMRKAIPIPFTIKTRTGWDENSKNILQIVDIANEQMVDAIVIHLRTKNQGFRKGIDIQSLTDAVKRSDIPVIGNGDISTPEDVKRMMETSGCAGVMIGRGALGAPWIFRLTIEYMQKEKFNLPSILAVRDIILEHLNLMAKFYDETKCVKLFRKHLVYYSKGGAVSPLLTAPGSSALRAGALTTDKLEYLIKLINEYFKYLMEIEHVQNKVTYSFKT